MLRVAEWLAILQGSRWQMMLTQMMVGAMVVLRKGSGGIWKVEPQTFLKD